MNSQKTGQALKEILDMCRAGNMQKERSAFRAALFDLLGGSRFTDERLVLKHAMDTDAFWTLLKTVQLTPDSAKKAADRIAKESHMAKEDAEFVVRCIAVAQGIDQNILSLVKSDGTGSAQRTDSAQRTGAAKSGGRDAQTRQEASVHRDAGTQPRDDPKLETAAPPGKQQDTDSLLLSAECRINCPWARIKKSSGKVYFYKGYLRFEPDTGDVYGVRNEATEISYSDIKKFNDMKAFFVVFYIIGFADMLIGICAGGAVGALIMMIPLLVLILFHFALRNLVGVCVRTGSLFTKRQCNFLFSKHADKKAAMRILKTWVS